MSTHISKFFKISLSLASAMLLIQTAAAGDFQQQVRDVLTGPSLRHSALRLKTSNDDPVKSSFDTWEYTRRVLLGSSAIDATNGSRRSAESAATIHDEGSALHPDTQAWVQSFLTGGRSSAAHGGPGSRRSPRTHHG